MNNKSNYICSYLSPESFDKLKEYQDKQQEEHRKSLKKLKRHFRNHWRYTRKQEENL